VGEKEASGAGKQKRIYLVVDWYLRLPVAKKKKSYDKDVERSKILKQHFGLKMAREIKPAMIESFQYEMLATPCQKKRELTSRPR